MSNLDRAANDLFIRDIVADLFREHYGAKAVFEIRRRIQSHIDHRNDAALNFWCAVLMLFEE